MELHYTTREVAKTAQKAEVAELKKMLKEKEKWEKEKFALKSIVAEIDARGGEIKI
jgi:crossover junction endonuclease EME1